MAIALEHVTKGALGFKVSEEEMKTIEDCYDLVMDEMEQRENGSQPTPEREGAFQQALADFKKIALDHAVKSSEESRVDDTTGTFIDFLRKEDNDDLIRDEFVSFLIGGFHTSGTLFTWALNAIGRRPDVQSRIQAEIDANVSGDLVAVNELKKLKYTRNVLHEVLRHYCLAPFAARYNVKESITFFDGTSVPAGMPCVLPLGKVLSDPDLWEKPEEFNPDRFEKPESK
jgi:cytochrome P450 family 20 subfamily A